MMQERPDDGPKETPVPPAQSQEAELALRAALDEDPEDGRAVELVAMRERMQRAVALGEELLPPDHPLLADGYEHLAWILQESSGAGGEISRDEVIELKLRSLTINEKLGRTTRDPPSSCYSELALLLMLVGRLEESLSFWQRAIQVDENQSPVNPSYLSAHSCGLADVYRRMGRLEEARDCMMRVIALREKYLKPSSLVGNRQILAKILWSLGQRHEALATLDWIATNMSKEPGNVQTQIWRERVLKLRNQWREELGK